MTTGTGATSAFLAAQALYFPSDASSAAEGEAQGPKSGDASGTAPTALSAEAREAAIQHAAKLIEKHMAEYERTGCFAARGMADRARMAMEALIRGRSAAQVARMEAERGLDLPACANEGRIGQ